MVNLRGFVDFEPNQENQELKLFKMDAKYNLKDIQRKKNKKIVKDIQRDSVPFLHLMDNFLTSDTLKNRGCDKMDVDYDYINDGITIFRKERSQIKRDSDFAF